jgi:energy-coupling factor transporter ATP-binding protein EcfA2
LEDAFPTQELRQKKRAALARLSHGARILVLDEPTANLDPKNRAISSISSTG